jgi:hypothetical protein
MKKSTPILKQSSLLTLFGVAKKSNGTEPSEPPRGGEKTEPPPAKRPRLDAEEAIKGSSLALLMASKGQAPALSKATAKPKKRGNEDLRPAVEVLTLKIVEKASVDGNPASSSSGSSSSSAEGTTAQFRSLQFSWVLNREGYSASAVEGTEEEAAPRQTANLKTAQTFVYGHPVPVTINEASFRTKLSAALPGYAQPAVTSVEEEEHAGGAAVDDDDAHHSALSAQRKQQHRFPKRVVELRLEVTLLSPAESDILLWQRHHQRSAPLTRLTKGVLQSALQKGIRRGRPASDIRALAAELWRVAPLDAVRRLIVIAIEDALLHPAMPCLIWMMLALQQHQNHREGGGGVSHSSYSSSSSSVTSSAAKATSSTSSSSSDIKATAVPASRGLGDVFEGLFLSIACDLAASTYKDRGGDVSEGRDDGDGEGEEEEDDDGEEGGGSKATSSSTSSASSSIAAVETAPTLPLGAVAGPGSGLASQADILAWSLLIRAGVGGGPWDMNLLITAASRWAARLLSSSSSASSSRTWFEGLYRCNNLPPPADPTTQCEYRLTRPFHTTETTNPITARGFVLEGIDYHCRPDMPYILLGLPQPSASSGPSSSSSSHKFVPKPGSHGVPSVADSARFLRLFEEAAAASSDSRGGHGENPAVSALHGAIWHFRSGINVRPSLPLPVETALASLSSSTAKRMTEAEALEWARKQRSESPKLLSAWDAILPSLRAWCIAELSSRLNTA